MSRIVFRDLNGIVLLDKPLGLSSNQALQQARRLFRAAKGGHTGALDPQASGMLPLCFGEATKVAGLLLGSAKRYRAMVQLGATTTTGDAEGDVLERRAVAAFDAARIDAVLASQVGRIRQRPPIYSALKVDGEPAYRRVRRGEEVVVAEREVEIFRIDLLQRGPDWLDIEVDCGSGTYIRSLAVDIGEALGCGAHIRALRRDWVDPFQSAPMLTLEALEQAAAAGDETLLAHLLPLQQGLARFPMIHLDAEQSLAIRQGRRVVIPDLASAETALALDDVGVPLALVQVDGGVIAIQRGLNLGPAQPTGGMASPSAGA
ncbi:tRNA pseudouridine(55) synthase TruB [Frateuria aurantia]